MDRSLPLDLITLLLKPSQTQQLALDQLLANQQNASSPDFHRWLTPEQFADRFGASPSDIAKIRTWLESQGLQINAVARGRGWITFGGTAARVAAAFQTEFHHYVVNGESHVANATEPSIPAAFAELIGGMNGLNDFGPETGPVNSKKLVSPKFEAGGFHFLSPADIATIYNIKPLHDAGIDGSGQTIVIIGASDVDPVDLFLFRALFQLPLNSPTMVLVGKDPGTNDALSEADLDLEWAGAVAPNAALTYVYGTDIFAAAQHAVDQNLAPIISMSFAYCEREITPGYRSVIQQASAQGITWVTGSGDAGAAGCDRNSYVSEATRGLSTTFPASAPEVTAVGGTTFAEGSGNYWAASSASNGGSALSYIPETAWNDTAGVNVLLGSGGGPSVLFSKPTWQQGPGVPNDGARDVPDIALAASPDHDGYLMFSGGNILLSGGTSVGTPEFAGMLALLNQFLSKSAQTPSRLGNLNPALYRLAQTTSDVFHDITTGDNMVPCAQGSPDCTTGSFGYSAGPGYDLVTGLGSLDVNKFVTEWAAATSTASSTTTVTATPNNIGFYGGSVQLKAIVSAAAGGTPTGSVAFVVNDVNLGSADLAGGSASVTVDASRIGLGNPSVTAVYSGDSNFSGSSGSVAMTVTPPAGAAIAVSVSPNPVYQEHPNPNGYTWSFTIRLTEEAGVAATITSFTVNGAKLSVTGFFGTATIPANGTVSSTLESRNLNAPTTQVFLIAGTDANGQSWSQQVSVQFLTTTLVSPGIKLASTPSTVFQNPSADPACQWLQQLTVQEVGGYTLELTKLTAGSADLSSQLQTIFGTTRLAAYGSLMGAACFAGLTPPVAQNYQLTAITDQGGTVGTTLSASFAGPAMSPPTPTVSPASVMIQAAPGSSADAGLALSFGGAPTAWTVSVLPDRAAGWLTVSPVSGAGAAQLSIHASGAALENGVYWATLVVQAVNALPQYINVPVVFVVGASTSTQIAGVSNGASYKAAFAPGMLMSVFGSQLAPSGTAESAGVIPLPLSVAGVSATVNGVAAPLYYVSSSQLNLQIPYETGAGPAVVGVNNNGQVASFLFQVAITAPGIFVDGNGAVVPAGSGKPGDTLSLFITGEGDVTPTLPTGNTPLPSTHVADLPQPRQPVTVSVGGMPATVQFIGIPVGLAGVTQINFTIPQNVAQGKQQVIVSVGGVQSQAAFLSVTQ